MSPRRPNRPAVDAPRKLNSRAIDTGTLAVGGVTALLASACCLGPLVLISLGLGGAWLANLSALEPYRLWFLGAAVVALVFAWRRIFRPASCNPRDLCAQSVARRGYKFAFFAVAALVAIGIGFPYLAPFFY